MKTILKLALCVALVSSLAFAKDEGDPTRYLTPVQEQALVDRVPAPPDPGSDEDKADLEKSVGAQKVRTEAVIAEAMRDEKFSFTLFNTVYGEDLDKNQKFVEIMDNVLAATKVVNETAKAKFKRPRPYQGHPDVVKGLFPVKGSSYPSGHSMGSYTLAVVLGDIFPDKKQEFLDRAAQIAQSRVNAGVHYFTDISEGGKLGAATGDEIVQSVIFQADVAKLKASLQVK